MLEHITDTAALRHGAGESLLVMFASTVGSLSGRFGGLGLIDTLPGPVLLLREGAEHCYYHAGIPGLTGSVEETVAFLQAVRSDLGCSRLTCFGISSGGYAALLHGCLVGADAVVAVGALTFLDHDLRDRLGGGERGVVGNVAMTWDAVYRHYAARGEAPRHLDLAALMASRPAAPKWALLHYAAGNREDRLHATHLAGLPRVRIQPHPLQRHELLAPYLLRSGVLQRDLHRLHVRPSGAAAPGLSRHPGPPPGR